MPIQLKCQQCGKEYLVPFKQRKFRKFCSYLCSHNSLERKNRISKSKKGIKLKIDKIKRRTSRLGSKNPNWKGGITSLNKKIRYSPEYKLWREAVFKRDDWSCVECGARSGNGFNVVLNADHIKPFASHPELRLELNNGRTLCVPCHKKTNTYKARNDLLVFKGELPSGGLPGQQRLPSLPGL